MRAFDWDEHEVRPDVADGRATPLWIRLLWLPGLVYLFATVLWAWNTHLLKADEPILMAAFWAFAGILASVGLSLLHMRVHRPESYSLAKQFAMVLMSIYWADKALHALIRHYRD